MTARYHGIGWLARNNDPYRAGTDGQEHDGPTLTLLANRESDVFGLVDHYTLLHQDDEQSKQRATALAEVLRTRAPSLTLKLVEVALAGPTDHEEIRRVVEPKLRELSGPNTEHAPLVHLSPGTPAMHAVWLLLCATQPAFSRAGGVLMESASDVERPTRVVEIDLPASYRLYRRFVSNGASADRSGIEDPGQLETPALREVFERASRLAQLRTPVLILGERGTGKSTLAAWIRHNTPRRSDPSADTVWQVACGEFSPELLASELFGHVKGAFTGAEKKREGLIVGVGDDTLFLDEVADLDRRLQRQIIKVVEEGQFRAVGADAIQETNARLLFATNHPEATLAERLDADFLDRIGYFRLTVPPLRECQSDHALLWASVVAQAGRRAGVDLASALAPALQGRILQAFASHPLPGNLRDFYLVAYHLCAALPDALTSAAVDTAFTELDRRRAASAVDTDPFRDLVRAWLERKTLDTVMREHDAVDVRAGVKALQSWFAREAKASSKRLGVDVVAWSGVPASTLSDWKQKPH